MNFRYYFPRTREGWIGLIVFSILLYLVLYVLSKLRL